MVKNRKIFITLMVITLCLCMGAVMFLSACGEEETPADNNIRPKREKVIETPDENTTDNPIDNPDDTTNEEPTEEEQTTTPEEPLEEEPVVAYTEVEYKQMCEDKLVDIIENYFETNRPDFELANVDFKIIDKLNNLVYFTGDLKGDFRFGAMTFTENVFDYDTYSDLYNNSLKNFNESNIVSFKMRTDFLNKVTEDSYNTFLDTIVKDQAFQDVLATEDIVIADDVRGWIDVASVVNVREFNRRSVDVKFIDFNNQKTVEVRVYSNLIIQESGNYQDIIDNLTIKEKTYTILEVKDLQHSQIQFN
ncbi:MAG: hypothetical protein ACOX24_00035 [Christensenellales bacterium]